MKERYINLKSWEGRAILEGRKTQKRWMVKPFPWFDGHRIRSCCGPTTKSKLSRYEDLISSFDGGIQRRCPYGSPGDRLWVRERHQLQSVSPHGYPQCLVGYKDGTVLICDPAKGDCVRPLSDDEQTLKIDHPRWRSSIHMPRWASRITLEVTNIRVERLQDISAGDAIAEGVAPDHYWDKWNSPTGKWTGFAHTFESSIAAYQEIWESINGLGSWADNPWVWVVEFQRVKGGAA